MIAVVRVVLLLLLAALLIGAVVGVFAGSTGILEKLVFAAIGVLVLIGASRVHRLGSRPVR
jgi:hypothetical protein